MARKSRIMVNKEETVSVSTGIYKTGIYARLSNEESGFDALENQICLLNGFVDEQPDMQVAGVYRDFGFSGTNFERPGFFALMEDVRRGQIDCIVVKDLSRLGRNYVEVGNLLEQVFPFLGIRIISVNDGYDSNFYVGQTGGLDVAFQNLVYSLYSRDLSNKIKSATATRMKRGEYTGTYGIFGYRKSAEDIHKLVIDKEAAAIVRRIFLMVCDGMPRREIVKVLNEEAVPTPAVYRQMKGCTRDWYPDGKKGGWNSSMIAKIIRDERYAGHMVGHKKVYESFDSKHQINLDKSEWIIVRNTHEGIVTQEEFDQANANMRNVAQGKRKALAGKRNFSVIICPYCGLRLRPGNKNDRFMYCPTGRTHREGPCQNVRIRKDVVENTLVELVRKQAEMMVTAEQVLKVKKKQGGCAAEKKLSEVKAECIRLESRKVSDYEDFKAGRISREDFIGRKEQLDVRKQELAAALKELEALAVAEECGSREYDEAFQIKEYLHLERFDKYVMASLIESAKVMGEDRLEVTWKYQDVYEKILTSVQ